MLEADSPATDELTMTPAPRKQTPSGKKRRLLFSHQGLAAAALLLVCLLATTGYAIINHLSYDEKQHRQLFTGIVNPAREQAAPQTAHDYATITVGSAPVRLPHGGDVGEIAMGFIGAGDALSVSQIIHPLILYGADIRRIHVVTAGEFEPQVGAPTGTSEVIVGGPSVSSRFLNLMAAILDVDDAQSPVGLSAGFRFRILPDGRQNAFAVAADKDEANRLLLGIEDVRTGQLCPVSVRSVSAGGTDAALVVRTRRQGRELLFVAGL